MIRRGFTLIELLLVLFILALMAGLTLPAVGRGVETLRLRAEVSTFSAFLRFAREQAITRRQAHTVTISPDAHRLTLSAAGADGPRATRRLSPSISVSADPPTGNTITFSPSGLSSGGSFRLAGPDGRAYRVRIDPLTGRVSIARVG